MKWAVFALSAAMLMASCHTLTPEEKAKQTAQVQQAIAERNMRFELRAAYPRRGGMITSVSDFFLEVRGDSVISYLPFYGRAYYIPLGGGKGLNFDAKIIDFIEQRVKKDMTRVVFDTHSGEDLYRFTLDIFDNGEATIYVLPQERDRIHYDAFLVF